jgi:hypothetical protein
MIAAVVREFLPWNQMLNYIEAIARYNTGRRDNKWKARIKIWSRAEGQGFIDAVEAEYQGHRRAGRRPHTITQADPAASAPLVVPELKPAKLPSSVNPQGQPTSAGSSRTRPPPGRPARRDPVVQAWALPPAMPTPTRWTPGPAGRPSAPARRA